MLTETITWGAGMFINIDPMGALQSVGGLTPRRFQIRFTASGG